MSMPKYWKNLLNTGEGSDFSIFVLDSEGNKIEKKVHKLVIRQCPYFAAMLDLKGKEAKNGSTTIDNISNNTFNYVLNYIYTEEIGNMTMEQAGEVVLAADYLQLATLRTAALDSWKDSLMKLKEKKDVVEAFRGLVASSLNIELDDSWREALELLLAATYDPEVKFDIVDESDSFIEFFIDAFGESHPCLAAHTLAEWATAVDLKLTKKQQKERKKLTEELLERIELTSLSLQTLVVLSRTEAFPALFMLKKLQMREELGDAPVCGKVEHYITLKTGRIVELKFESGYALFRFVGFDEVEAANETPLIWEFLHVPDNCETKVKSWLAVDDKERSWPANAFQGGLAGSLKLNQFQYQSGEFYFSVFLSREESKDDAVKFKYDYEYDLDQELFGSRVCDFFRSVSKSVLPLYLKENARYLTQDWRRNYWELLLPMGLPEHLINMLSIGEGCDFSIIFLDNENNKVVKRAHKLILRRSLFFSAMLDLQGTEAKNGSVTIENITKETFDIVLHYLYTDKLRNDITMEQALDVASAGDYLHLKEMKNLAIQRWKSLYVVLKDNNEAISHLRSFAAAQLNVKPDLKWRRVAEVFIIAMCDSETHFKIEMESSSFVEFLVNLCGFYYAFFTARDIVCDWVIAKKSNLTEKEQKERRDLAARLAEQIEFYRLSLQSLVVLSKNDVFPIEYLLETMQAVAYGGDSPAVDEVNYTLNFESSRLVELEYENLFVLFNFEVDTNGNVTWKFVVDSDSDYQSGN